MTDKINPNIHKCGAWFEPCPRCGKKVFCPSCDDSAGMCKSCAKPTRPMTPRQAAITRATPTALPLSLVASLPPEPDNAAEYQYMRDLTAKLYEAHDLPPDAPTVFRNKVTSWIEVNMKTRWVQVVYGYQNVDVAIKFGYPEDRSLAWQILHGQRHYGRAAAHLVVLHEFAHVLQAKWGYLRRKSGRLQAHDQNFANIMLSLIEANPIPA